MKRVCNRKLWDERGWVYQFRRVVNGQFYSYDLVITKYEMHKRDFVAKRLKQARRCLQAYILARAWPNRRIIRVT